MHWLHYTRGLRATEDVLGGEDVIYEDVDGRMHRFVPIEASGCSRSASNCRVNTSGHGVGQIGSEFRFEEWQVFVQSIPSREKLPDWEEMWATLQ